MYSGATLRSPLQVNNSQIMRYFVYFSTQKNFCRTFKSRFNVAVGDIADGSVTTAKLVADAVPATC